MSTLLQSTVLQSTVLQTAPEHRAAEQRAPAWLQSTMHQTVVNLSTALHALALSLLKTVLSRAPPCSAVLKRTCT